MTNPDAPRTELLGAQRADLLFLAECLEGKLGQGRIAEAAPLAARFIRGALAARIPLVAAGPLPRLVVDRALTDNDLEAQQLQPQAPSIGLNPDGSGLYLLTERERRMIEKQRAHEARNASNEEDGNGGLPPA